MLKKDEKNQILFRLFFVFICSALMFSANASEQPQTKEGNTLVFGFLPIISTQKLIKRFNPLAEYISLVVGQPVRFETAPNYKEFVQRTRNKRYDIIFTAPHFYYLAKRDAGYRALVRVGAPALKAIIVANKKDNVTQLKDLKGKRLSTPDVLSLGSVLIRNKIRSIGLDPDKDLTIITTPSHNSSLQSAFIGVTNAAGLMILPYKRASSEIRNQMVELGKTKGTPHMPIAVSPNLSNHTADIIMQSLVALKNTKKGMVLLKHLSWEMGFVKVKPNEYDKLKLIVKELDL